MTEEIIINEKSLQAVLKRYDELEQENKELGRKAFLAEQNVRTTAATFCEKDNKIKKLEQENKELYNDGQTEITRLCNENSKLKSALEEINRVVKLAHKVEDYLLGQDYTDLVDRIQNKINEVLNDSEC